MSHVYKVIVWQQPQRCEESSVHHWSLSSIPAIKANLQQTLLFAVCTSLGPIRGALFPPPHKMTFVFRSWDGFHVMCIWLCYLQMHQWEQSVLSISLFFFSPSLFLSLSASSQVCGCWICRQANRQNASFVITCRHISLYKQYPSVCVSYVLSLSCKKHMSSKFEFWVTEKEVSKVCTKFYACEMIHNCSSLTFFLFLCGRGCILCGHSGVQMRF